MIIKNSYLSPASLLSSLALLMMLATCAILIYLLFIERPPIRYTNLPFPVTNKAVRAGDVIPLTISRCNDSNTRTTIFSSRLLENTSNDQGVIVLEIIGLWVPPGCVTETVSTNRIPKSVQPGTYRISGIATVPGLIRNFFVPWHSEPFTVLPPFSPVPLVTPK